jgi:4-carboxymuconolactone decarboxylase
MKNKYIWIAVTLLLCSFAMAQERLGAIPKDAYSDAQKKVVAEIATGPRAEIFSPLLPMLRSPELAYAAERFGESVYYQSQLDKRIYELAVLILARQTSQQFEWRVHYPLAIKLGIKQENIDAIGAGRRPLHLADDEQILYAFVVELLRTNQISDANYARFVDRFGERGVIDLVGLLGYYNTIAIMMNVDRTPVSPGATPLLKALRTPLP